MKVDFDGVSDYHYAFLRDAHTAALRVLNGEKDEN